MSSQQTSTSSESVRNPLEGILDLKYLQELSEIIFKSTFPEKEGFDPSSLTSEQIKLFITNLFNAIFKYKPSLNYLFPPSVICDIGPASGIKIASFFGQKDIGDKRQDFGIHILTAETTEEMTRLVNIYLMFVNLILQRIKLTKINELNSLGIIDEDTISSEIKKVKLKTVFIINGPILPVDITLAIKTINEKLLEAGFLLSNVISFSIVKKTDAAFMIKQMIFRTRKKPKDKRAINQESNLTLDNTDHTFSGFTPDNITKLIHEVTDSLVKTQDTKES